MAPLPPQRPPRTTIGLHRRNTVAAYLVACVRQSARHVIDQAFDRDVSQPLPLLRQPIENRDGRIKLEVELVRVGAAIRRALGGAEIVDEIEVPSDPVTRLILRDECELRFELEFHWIVTNCGCPKIVSGPAGERIRVGVAEGRPVGFDRELQPWEPRRNICR
jgi:hypothetical protein